MNLPPEIKEMLILAVKTGLTQRRQWWNEPHRVMLTVEAKPKKKRAKR